jgi:hypothetical protein
VLDGGRQVSPHDPLLPLVLAPAMGLGGWRAAKVEMAMLAGLLAAAMVWLAVVRAGLPVRRAALGVAAFSLTAPLAVYGTQVYPELPAALVVTVAVAAGSGALSRRALVTLAVAVSALVWLSVKYAPVGAVIAAVALWRLWRDGRRRDLAWLTGGLALSGVVFAAVHLAIYGGLTPYATGDHFTSGELGVVGSDPNYIGRSRRLVNLLVDRDFGIAAWQPLWLAAVPAAVALGRRRPSWWAPVLLPAAVGWLSATFVALTMQGYWWPGRQLVVVLPLLAVAITGWAPMRVLAAGLVLGVTTWTWLVVDGVHDHVTWVFRFWDTGAPAYRVLRLLLPAAGDDALLGGWALVLAAAAAVAWRLGGADEDAAAGEGADADGLALDAHGDGPVG